MAANLAHITPFAGLAIPGLDDKKPEISLPFIGFLAFNDTAGAVERRRALTRLALEEQIKIFILFQHQTPVATRAGDDRAV